MRRLIAPLFAAALLPLPALAQEAEPDTGRSLMERGVELFFEGLREEMAPTVEELRGLAEEYGPAMRSFMSEMGPALADMFEQVRDWTAYHPPEMLPNGDIILRKRQPEPDDAPDDPDPAPAEDAPPMGPTDI